MGRRENSFGVVFVQQIDGEAFESRALVVSRGGLVVDDTVFEECPGPFQHA